MRKHHKRTVQSGGATLDGKIPLPLMKRGRDSSYAEDRTKEWF
jgi:hypothetical protein